MNINVLKEKCCGCGLCSVSCPAKCIKMVENSEGFMYPMIDENACLDCGVCKKKCPSLEGCVNLYNSMKVYVAKSKDEEIYEKAASGGIATEIAKMVISNGGIVYGCMLDECLNTRHVRINCLDDLHLIQNSKYTQSSILNIFEQIKQDIEKEYNIAFFGTPCQVAAIKRQFSNKIEQLLLIDLICHGVTNDKIFHQYLQFIEKKEEGKVIEYSYRDKSSNQYSRCETIYIDSKKGPIKKINGIIDSPFYYGYMNNYISRKSCYFCEYKQSKRVGDITLGDFWKVDQVLDGIENDLGYSRIITNTTKGCEVVKSLSTVFLQEVKNSELKTEKNSISKIRKAFFDSWDEGGYDWSILKPKKYLLRKLYSKIPFDIRKRLYRWMK